MKVTHKLQQPTNNSASDLTFTYPKGKHTCTPCKETGAQASSLLSQKDKVSPSKHKKLTINMHDKSRYMARQIPLHGTTNPARVFSKPIE